MSSRRFRTRRRRRQDLLSSALCLVLTGLHAWVLYQAHPRLPRRRPRTPLAVALVSTPQRRLPPTPSILPPPPTLKTDASPRKARAAAQALKSAIEKRAHNGDRPVPGHEKTREPDRPPTATAEEVSDAAEDGSGTGAEGAADRGAEPEEEPEQVVVQAGGRRSCAFDGPGAPADAVWSANPLPRPEWPATLFAPFRTRPALGDYLGGLEVLGRVGPRALGTYRIALPEDVVRVELDEPRGAALYVGRTDARCVVMATLRGRPLQLRLRGVPLRAVDRARRVASAIVDVTMGEDARLELVHRAGDKLPFTRARLANGGAVAATLTGHLNLAQRWGR